MVYDGAVSAIKHGAVFASVGSTITTIAILIMMPFIAYTILKTASVAAKGVILKTVSVCKSTTVTIMKLQAKTCKLTIKVVANLTKTSLNMTKLLLKQMISTMRRLVGFGKTYTRLCLNTVLKFKDVTIAFVKRGLQLIKMELNITVKTIRKLAEIVLDILIKMPKALYKFVELILTKVFPGIVKIMIYFPQQYYMFITKWLPKEINFIFNMCKTILELDLGATAIIVLFQLIGSGIKFIGRFFDIGKQFVGDFVSGINGALDVIPSFGDVLNSDTIASIPDKIINFILYELNFSSGMNAVLDAEETSLPLIEAKESEITALAFELESFESRRKALIQQVEISPNEEAQLEISRLGVIVDGLNIQLEVLKNELSVLEINRVFTFDELALRTYFCVISLGNVYLEPPPIPKLVTILINGIFNRELTPRIVIPIRISETIDLELVEIDFTIGITITINPFTLGLLYPQAEAANKLAIWLNDRLLREEAYEIVDGKKKSKIRKASGNPACFAKLYIRVLYYWIKILLTELNFDILSLVRYEFSTDVDVEALGIDIDTGDYGLGDVLDYLNVGSLTELATRNLFEQIGNAVTFLSDNVVNQLVNVVFAGLSVGCSENYEFLS